MEQGVLEVLNSCGEWKTPRRAAKVCLLNRSMDKVGIHFCLERLRDL